MEDLSITDINGSLKLDNISWSQIVENLSDVCQLKINESMFTGTQTDKVQEIIMIQKNDFWKLF